MIRGALTNIIFGWEEVTRGKRSLENPYGVAPVTGTLPGGIVTNVSRIQHIPFRVRILMLFTAVD